MQERKALDANAYALMVLCTALWGFQQVAIKVVAADVTLVMQGALRSLLATALLLAWAASRGIALFERDGTLRAGLLAGLLFGVEFVFIYAGLAHTHASRMVVFIYLGPPLTALGLHLLVPAERLKPLQWAGVLLAFGGLVLAFSDGFLHGRATWLGDLCGVAAAFLWSATTIVIRTTRLASATATKTLFYQLAVSSAVLLAGSVLLGGASLLYQGAIVAFASYLAWFSLLTRYLAAPLSVFSFLTPFFGVVFGVTFLGESLSGVFALAALLVGAGIALVNIRR